MRTAFSFAAIGLLLCGAGPAAAQHWPQFRGLEMSGVVSGANIPSAWSMEQNLAWKVKLPGVGWSQPVVWGDKVFVTTAATDNQPQPKPGDWGPGGALGGLGVFIGLGGKPPNVPYRWQVICLDAKTGEVLWSQVAREGKPANRIHANNSYASETPATDGERLIVSFGPAGLYCYDLTGKLLWSKDLGTYPIMFDWGTGSSPVIFGDAVYVQCDNDKASFLVALNKQTGDELWRVERDEKSNWSTPYVWKNKARTELVAAGGTKMRSYDPATGKLIWEMSASGRTATTPIGDDELLYVDSYDRLTGNRGVLAAVRAGAAGDTSLKDGETANDSVAWSVRLTSARVGSPLLAGGCLYVLDQMAGIIRCLDAKTGKEHYRQRLPGAAGFTASPWSSGSNVFCLDQNGQTFVLSAGPEFKLLATNKLDREMFWSSPAIAGDSLLLRGAEHLYCVRQGGSAGAKP
jgi:outer membrane protein assembly factor BamB